MAANIDGVFNKDLQNAILNSKILVVGAGGIGCEILKNLVMTGFKDIEIVSYMVMFVLIASCMHFYNKLTIYYYHLSQC